MEPKPKSIARTFGYAAIVCVFSVTGYFLLEIGRLSWRCRAYKAELDAQLSVIDSIARQVPDPTLRQEGSQVLARCIMFGATRCRRSSFQ